MSASLKEWREIRLRAFVGVLIGVATAVDNQAITTLTKILKVV